MVNLQTNEIFCPSLEVKVIVGLRTVPSNPANHTMLIKLKIGIELFQQSSCGYGLLKTLDPSFYFCLDCIWEF